MKWLFRLIAIIAIALRLRPAEDEPLTPEEIDALGDALLPDGSVDTARLIAMSKPLDIDALRREVTDADTPVVPVHHS